MKTYVLLAMMSLLTVSCNGQEPEIQKRDKNTVEQPKGSWNVNKEFDADGNLIRYDSIYSWSSYDTLDKLSAADRDSLLQHMKSRFFTNFSGFENQGFEHVFTNDSIFSKHYFNDDFFGSDFGHDFMDIDKIRQQMIARQKAFLEKYNEALIKPEDEN
ncbi:conserved hypothetical protein [Formosa agariphila KMM 3901]|uniref:Lipoprotein n=2 Tax=Formosa TaxID=225842 RepID=T2KNG0_FORAG|nr:conserved hypothetical protein [Formosa agariphila KMM 3901]